MKTNINSRLMNDKDEKTHTHKSKQHNNHQNHSLEDFKKRFYVSLLFTLPILSISPFIQDLFNYQLTFKGDKILLLAISSLVFFYGGRPFLLGAVHEIKNRSLGMMTLIALAISVAYVYSFSAVLWLDGKVFFWELVTLIDIMLLGHWIEMKSVMGASKALDKLQSLIPNYAFLKKDGKVRKIEISKLKKGDTILVKPGARIPIDGKVTKGESFVNEAMLTGESKPINKSKGSKVIGGAINQDGSLEISVLETSDNTYLSQVVKMVKEAQESKSKTEKLADKAAFWLTLIAIFTGLATFFVWLLKSNDWALAIERTATVLVITCPHALGLAIPLVTATSTTLSAKNGLLIRNRTAFENSRKISTIVFDKTGTLTKGVFSVNKIKSFVKNLSESEILKIAAALEQNSQHPIGKAIIKKSKEERINLIDVNDFKNIQGKGIKGKIKNKNYWAVSPGFLKENNLAIPNQFKKSIETVIYILNKNNNSFKKIGAISLNDEIRSGSFKAVNELKKQGLKIWMLTGDNQKTAEKVSKELKLNGYFAQVLPDEKQNKIKKLQSKGEYVAMVGDGINDAPALATADIGIAIGSGTDIASQTADVILVKSKPQDIVSLLALGKATYKKMLQNLFWATGYNLFAIPLAAGVLSGYGIILNPAVGALLMSLSTVIVAINAKILKLN
ncbi:MAG: copper-translocating P-type ATPase [Candidatus Moranbacteria bacterium]|nr:copper-translocating P-type ATPase [Candidatus Moranbacteria bacterium]